ncbi:MAG TPA: NAD(P)/FAD-dependent oxidoreductase [Bacteroidales bacterium]|nr:NAD(P)/FAD-dependent oxidoreductase [Bacteroidales bacterium]
MIPVTNIPDPGLRKRVVIAGGGFAGLKLARKLDRRLFQVILLDRQNYHQFQPLFYQVATSGLEPSAIAFPFRKIFQNEEAFHFRLCQVLKVLPDTREVETDIGSLHYDFFVIAIGCDTNFFGNKDLQKRTMTLKSIPEALDIRNHILQSFEAALNTPEENRSSSLLAFVIVGGGPTGVELAGALAEMKKYILPKDYPELDPARMQVTLIDSNAKLLGSMSEKASASALRFVKKLGVNVILNTFVREYTDNRVLLSNGENIVSSNVFWVAGISGNIMQGIRKESIGRGYRLLVDKFNLVNGHDNVFAIGDNCLMVTDKYPAGHPQVAQVAIQQGRLLAGNLKRVVKGQSPKEFVYKDRGSMATVGRNLAVADIHLLKFSGFPAWVIWLFVHLMSIVGTKNRLFIFLNWMWNYLTFDQSLRLVIKTKETVREEL